MAHFSRRAAGYRIEQGFPKYRRTQCEEGWIKQRLRKHGLSVDDLKRDCGKVLCITQIVECRKKSDGSYLFVLRRKPMTYVPPTHLHTAAGLHLELVEVEMIVRFTLVFHSPRKRC